MDARFALSLIASQFSDLSSATLTYLGEGMDSTAFEVNGELVFRFPKRAEVDEQTLVETRMLDALGPGAPLPIPAFTYRGEPSAAFPFHFAGYRKLPGVEAILLDPSVVPFDALAAPLGKFLGWLHAFPVKQALSLGAQSHDAVSVFEEFRAEALECFDAIAGVLPAEEVARWRALVSRAPFSAGVPDGGVLLHSDFYQEHLLLDPDARAITGVIDWGDVEVGDPAIDFAGLFAWGGAAFTRNVLEHYEPATDHRLLERARWLAGFRSAVDVKYGVERQRPEFLAAGRRGLAWAEADL